MVYTPWMDNRIVNLNANEHCVVFRYTDGSFDDLSCTNLHPFICKVPKGFSSLYIHEFKKHNCILMGFFFFRKKLICTKITCFYVIDKDHQSSECSNLLISICEASTFTSIENIKKKISNIIFLKFGRNVISQKY